MSEMKTPNALTLAALHRANIERRAEWCPDQVPDLSFRGNELAGETGEACNVIKKLERERQGWRGSRASLSDLAEELADVVICADLCAVTAGIDLAAAVVAKFNATSEKQGLATKLGVEEDAVAQLTRERDAAIKVQEMCATSGGFYARRAENAEARAQTAEAGVARLTEALRSLDEMIFHDPQVIESAGFFRDFIARRLGPVQVENQRRQADAE
ncbi:MazG-like family protein [Methylobacterium planeticum]|uniref:Uncharacterized protein n=1 Tax=Methylobacterium planeticum TaxID=2615211 RepID=A0A6N6MKS7_9HYPH|nr:MazG-like family protein [Methylobacterium planeticum]KAB1068865.1 hypothetical protein F6X51_26030 [Methylobacterium planeticum]